MSDPLERAVERARDDKLLAEIDRLRAENATQDKLILEWGDRYADLSNETDRLRAENAEMLPFVRLIAEIVLWQDLYADGPDHTNAGMGGKRPTVGAGVKEVRKARAILAKTAKEL